MENFIHYNREIVGPGWIAHDMANALIQEDVGVYGVASGHYSSTKKFFEEFSIKHVYENYQAMFKMEILILSIMRLRITRIMKL